MWSLRVRSLAMVLAPMVAGCGIAHHQLSLRFSGIVRDDVDRPVNGAAVTVLSPLPVSGEDALTDLPPPYRSMASGLTDTDGRFDISSTQLYQVRQFYPTRFVLAGGVYGAFVTVMLVGAAIVIITRSRSVKDHVERIEDRIFKVADSKPVTCMVEYPCSKPHPSPLFVRVESPDGSSAAVEVDGQQHFTGIADVVQRYDIGEIVVRKHIPPSPEVGVRCAPSATSPSNLPVVRMAPSVVTIASN